MNFVSWSNLATYGGCLAMVLAITQFTKSLPFLKKIPTQLWSFLLALLVLIPAYYFSSSLTVSNLFLILFDAVIVSLAANGGFHALNKAFPSLFSFSGSAADTSD